MHADRGRPRIDRRALLRGGGLGLGSLALAHLLGRELAASDDPLRARAPMFAPRARRVIYLHMIGAPSQLDLFDPKPELNARDGQECPASLLEGRRFAFLGGPMTLAGSRWRFERHGESGHPFSELVPHMAGVADELMFVRSMHTEEINHAPAQIFQNTGFGRGGRPSFGSWVAYGLGTENQDLPAFVVLRSGLLGGAGTALWSSGFLPGAYQGTPFRPVGDPVLFLSNPNGQGRADRRRVLDAVRTLNEANLAEIGDPEIAARIEQYELAFRMQMSVPELVDLSSEPQEVLDLYGATLERNSFANNCLLARRLVERGVRVVELYDADWDHHLNIATQLPAKCQDVDRGIAALITDLRRRGLLEDTLVIFSGEFGRTPLAQSFDGDGKPTNPGRDHHKDAYTLWMAGAGVRAGTSVGATDELGFGVTENPVHLHDFNATVLHLLGLDHERLTYRHQGREFRLTDVHGRVVPEMLG